MQSSFPIQLVRVLLIASALATIGVAGYRFKLAGSPPPATPVPMPQPPADLSTLTVDQRLTLLQSLQDQLKSSREAFERDREFRAQRRTTNSMMMSTSLLTASLSLIYALLRRRGGGNVP